MSISVGTDLYNYFTDATSTSLDSTINKTYESADDVELLDACKEFETYFLEKCFKQMKATIPDGGLFEKGQAEEYYEEALIEEYAKKATEGGGIGIAKMLYEQMKRC